MTLLSALTCGYLFYMYITQSQQQCRDRLESPFSSTSIWNMPIGSDAEFIDANVFDGSHVHPLPSKFIGDVDWFFAVTNNDKSYPWYNQGHWGGPHTYDAYCNITGNYVSDLLFPSNVTITNFGNNNAAAILQPDNVTLFQMQPIYRCNQSGPILAKIGCMEHGTSNISILSDGIYGCHGGSGLSSIGGTLRNKEIIGNENDLLTIKHALKLEFNGTLYYYNASSSSNCYKWPACQCDYRYYDRYGGTNPYFQPGSLLAIPSDVKINSLNLTTVPGKKIFYALQNYGGYIVDDAGVVNRGTICVVQGLMEEFESYYGYSYDTYKGDTFYNDLVLVFQQLKIVKNNSPTSIGGGGTPIQPLSPPICQ